MKKTYIAPISEKVYVKGGELLDAIVGRPSQNPDHIPGWEEPATDDAGAKENTWNKGFTSAELWEEDD